MQSLCENNVLGIIVNGARRGELYSKYTYYHSYYYAKPEESLAPRKTEPLDPVNWVHEVRPGARRRCHLCAPLVVCGWPRMVRTSGSPAIAIWAKPSMRIPTTQNEAVEEFRKALALAPQSSRERLNYGLALLRAGKTAEGIAELIDVQKQDPSIPHTWFNLGIAYKKAGEEAKAIAQFEQMVKLVPDDADFSIQPRSALSSDRAVLRKPSNISGPPRSSIPHWLRPTFSSSTCSVRLAARKRPSPSSRFFSG